MTLRVTFDLTDTDLNHFRGVMRRAIKAHKDTDEADIIAAASTLLEQVNEKKAPNFISDRLGRLKVLINMVQDEGWALPQPERRRVMSALAYFSDPEDLIPDEIPGLGFLDDAIMIELAARELKHEIEAYRDFCVFRSTEAARRKISEDELAREDFLVTRRKRLHSRIKSRRSRRRRSGGSVGNFKLF
ncbi:MAG: YkvA family protein [Pseudomonadota bacterium]